MLHIHLAVKGPEVEGDEGSSFEQPADCEMRKKFMQSQTQKEGCPSIFTLVWLSNKSTVSSLADTRKQKV